MSITDLQETSPNNWKAKYRGNHGTYTIKITTDGTSKPSSFSCTCPSHYYPCKHIPIVLNEIKERKAKFEKTSSEEKGMSIEDVLKSASADELRAFIVRLAKYNPELTNSIMLEFSHKISKDNTHKDKANNYSSIIRTALQDFDIDDEDVYDYDGCIEIEALDQWLEKAQEYANQGNDKEAVCICKACIEEYASWLEKMDHYMVDYMDENYLYTPFVILNDIISNSDEFSKELFEYCKTEMLETKYKGTGFHNEFNDLLGKLALTTDPESFIALQNKLLAGILDKKSSAAKQVFQRLVDFYRKADQPEKAWKIIENNLQIESFRKELTERKIAENKLAEAKKLIKDQLLENGNYNKYNWNTLLLTIAEKENDIPAIREISFLLIEHRFELATYEKYKSTFDPKEWALKTESLIRHYQKDNNLFNYSVAEVLIQEKQFERLMNYVEKDLSIGLLEKYHTYFPSPEKTLLLFRKSIDEYAKRNMGRNHYEYIAQRLDNMRKIIGGQAVVNDMISQYRILYKNRRAMMEILHVK